QSIKLRLGQHKDRAVLRDGNARIAPTRYEQRFLTDKLAGSHLALLLFSAIRAGIEDHAAAGQEDIHRLRVFALPVQPIAGSVTLLLECTRDNFGLFWRQVSKQRQ